MKGNGVQAIKQLAPDAAHQISADTVMECDYCYEPMDFNEYSSHSCPGLGGRNPMQEKMKKARWKAPGQSGFVEDTRGIIGGTVRASGSIVGQRPYRFPWLLLSVLLFTALVFISALLIYE